MPLVKKAALGNRAPAAGQPPAAPATPRAVRKPKAKRPTNAVERIDQATQELASGLAEAAAAAAELQQSVERISSSAEEAAGAAQESLGLIGSLRGGFRESSERAAASERQTELLQAEFADAATQIEASVAAIVLNAERQSGSVAIVDRLSTAAANISAVGEKVGDLSEQTSMLALNASIEAARAGDDGKGFAIVADEVRELAETAERSAGDIQALAREIIDEIGQVAERIAAASELAAGEAAGGERIVGSLNEGRGELAALLSGAQDIATAAAEAEAAATEAEQGAEQVASAAEEQSAAAAEAQQAIQQQAVSLDQSQQTGESLGSLTTQLDVNATDMGAVQQVAAAAEELSATVQELSGASGQILVAIEQIARGAQVQSAATLQAGTAMAQIERSAELAQSRAGSAAERATALAERVAQDRAGVGALVDGVVRSVGDTRAMLDRLTGIGETARRIEKISDALGMIALQTNMLAVSGAVEATRAGEAGAGFATVTADIRKLAREAAGNAEQAKDVVRAIQDQLAMMRRDLDLIAAAGETEAARNRATIERFAGMAAAIDETREANGLILQGSDAILRSAREVKSGCDEIAIAAEQAASAAREAGVAARQQAQGAEDLAAAIEDIATLAASLIDKQG